MRTDGSARVRRLEDGLTAGREEHEATLPAQQEEEEHRAHELRVKLADRLAQGEGVHLLAVAKARLPAQEGAVAAHGEKDGRHRGSMPPVQQKVGRKSRGLGTLKEWHPDVHVGRDGGLDGVQSEERSVHFRHESARRDHCRAYGRHGRERRRQRNHGEHDGSVRRFSDSGIQAVRCREGDQKCHTLHRHGAPNTRRIGLLVVWAHTVSMTPALGSRLAEPRFPRLASALLGAVFATRFIL